MTDESVDPRFDAAFQRGFEGRVEARPEQLNAFARPDAAQPDAPRRARRAAPVVADGAAAERALGPVIPAPIAPRVLEPRVEEPQAVEDAPGAEEPERPERSAGALVPLRSNPWFLALLGCGAVLSIVGYALLYWALATPLASFTGSDDSTNAYVLHQMAFYISVPLLAGLPTAVLLALALLAARWSRGTRAAREGAAR
ncbi:hypothetical protein HQQ81_04200 [Microbacteriaceae bacterium VKM Ac-2854]|nr:hypothetical protein [Microbacteriaceae bacterium VKM Ac-2854]